jgi:phenylacetate-CoA ligase
LKVPYTFPRALWFYAKIRRNPWRNPSELRTLQERMFKSVLTHAYENTAFYHQLYKEQGIKPTDIKSLTDVHKLPIVSKQDLRDSAVQRRVSRRFDISKCREGRTSGSTGEPFRVYIEPRAADYLQALHLRRLFIYGYKPWFTIVILGPFWMRTATLKRRSVRPSFLNMVELDANGLSVSDDPLENVTRLKALQPHVVWCPPSYLRLLTEAAQRSGVTDIKPRILICGAEVLDPKTRQLAERAYGVRVFDEYGTVDVASRAIAWQCERHENYHINLDSVYLEFIDDDGHLVSPGEEGRIVATSLFRFATPMVRYLIGDIAVPSEEMCPCGRSFPLMESIQGRADDCLSLPDGRLISPLTAMAVMEHIQGVRKYRIVQESVDKLIFHVEPEVGRENIAEEVQRRFSKVLGDQVTLTIKLGSIDQPLGKKVRIVTSNVK